MEFHDLASVSELKMNVYYIPLERENIEPAIDAFMVLKQSLVEYLSATTDQSMFGRNPNQSRMV